MSKVLHQVVDGATAGDAITDHALLLRTWLREMGFTSEVYGWHIHDSMKQEVLPITSYHGRDPYVIFHHSIGSHTVNEVLKWPTKLIVIYHNITPAEFFDRIDPMWAGLMRLGREQLHLLRPRTVWAMGDSDYNEAELIEYGYSPTSVLPLSFNPRQYDTPLDPQIGQKMKERGPNLLFVGRMSPNKRQEDLLKLLYHYKKINPGVRLILVGQKWLKPYVAWLEDFIQLLGLQHDVWIPGHVTFEQMTTFFRTADLYLSMSEHEGFGKPFMESMYCGLPIMAYASTSIPSTLGRTGIMFHDKNFPLLAEAIDLVLQDKPFLERLKAQQTERVQTFFEPNIRALFVDTLQKILPL